MHSRQSDGRENSFFLFSSFSSVRFHALDTFCKPSRELNEAAADGRLGRNVTRESAVTTSSTWELSWPLSPSAISPMSPEPDLGAGKRSTIYFTLLQVYVHYKSEITL